MKISYNILNTFFDGKLPQPSRLEEAFTFHSFEVEEVIEKDGDTLFDIKVLPDKSAWALSHRGIAKDLSVVLDLPLTVDPFLQKIELEPLTDMVSVRIDTTACDRYAAAYVKGVVVSESPQWLQKHLAALGQRSINNVVDATNYVMFLLGQPLHAFDAGKLSGLSIGVRNAKAEEIITTLTGESYTLSEEDTLIVDATSDLPIGIAGIKGGKVAQVDEETQDLIIESAHFDAVAVRKTSQRFKLRTDASQRYENGIVKHVAVYALHEVVRIILEVARGTLIGYVDVRNDLEIRQPVSVSLGKINSVLGLSLSKEEVEIIIVRFGYEHFWKAEVLTLTPPFERPDIVIPEDVIEEIGRVHGYEHVQSVTPSPLPLIEVNKTFYYVDMVRSVLAEAGFSEVFTSSFSEKDEVKLKNAFASDKGYLRSQLSVNMKEALKKNAPLADLLGIKQVAVFEIGNVFKQHGEGLHICLGVRSPGGYKAKQDDPVLQRGIEAVNSVVGNISWNVEEDVTEARIDTVFETLNTVERYAAFTKIPDIVYQSFSLYPFASRDIAFWVDEGKKEEELEKLIREHAGPLLVRLDLFDRFIKEERVSYAFRLVFQSYEKTLTAEEVQEKIVLIIKALEEAGCIIR